MLQSGRVPAEEYRQQYYDVLVEQSERLSLLVENILDFAKKNEYVETLFGRRRYIPEINASKYSVRAGAERMAINMPIQGTSADLIKLAMVEIEKKLENKWKNHAKILLQVHDELVFEVRESRLKSFAKEVRTIMEDVVKLAVPINVDVEVGNNWEELEEMETV